jgi:catechol 2,3-dioxygenase-like lactoylglutathione lyase family enzyme
VPIGPARIFHVNANCSDLERSLAFYTERLGLRPTVRTTVEPQPCQALGLDLGAWDAWLLGPAEGHGVVLDLLEWQTPAPVGQPVGRHDLGYTTLIVESPDAPGLDADPDGTSLEVRPGDRARLAGVRVGVRDVERSMAWWSDVVGLGASDGVLADDRGPRAFAVELVAGPEAAAPPSSSANRLGPYRMALLTDSIDEDHRFLVDRGVACLSDVADLDMGPGLPALRVLCFLDPDGTVVELIESPDVSS